MNHPRDSNFSDYLAAALEAPVEAAAYIEAALELDDPAALLVAMRHVAQAHGMAAVTRRAGMGEKSLFRALSPTGNPTLTTVHKALHAMGLRLSVQPLDESEVACRFRRRLPRRGKNPHRHRLAR